MSVDAGRWFAAAAQSPLEEALWSRGNFRVGTALTANEQARAVAAKKELMNRMMEELKAADKGSTEAQEIALQQARLFDFLYQSGAYANKKEAQDAAGVTWALLSSLPRLRADVASAAEVVARIAGVESELDGKRPTPETAAAEIADAVERKVPLATYDGPLATEIDRADAEMNKTPWGGKAAPAGGETAASVPAAAPSAAPAIVPGATESPAAQTLHLPGGKALRYRVVVREMGDVVASHDAVTLAPDPRHVDKDGKRINERLREKEAANLAQSYDQPLVNDLVNRDAPTAESGPMIIARVGDKWLVLGGNGRDLRVQRNYMAGDKSGYKADVVARAPAHGIDPAAVATMERPGLFRELLDVNEDDDLQALSVALNGVMTEAKDAAEEAVSRGRAVGENVLAVMADAGDGETVAQFIDRANKRLAEAMAKDGVFSAEEAARFARDGELTPEGRDLARYAMLGAVLPSGKLIRRLTDAQERAILAAAPAVLSTKGRGAYDLTPLVPLVAAHYAQKRGQSWAEYALPGLFDDSKAVAPVGAAFELAKFLDTHKAAEIRAALDAYRAAVPADSASGDLFGGSFLTPGEALAKAIGVDPALTNDPALMQGALAQAAAMYRYRGGGLGQFIADVDAGKMDGAKAFFPLGEGYAFAPGLRFDLPSDVVNHARKHHAGQGAIAKLEDILPRIDAANVRAGTESRYGGAPWVFYAEVDGVAYGGAFETFPSGRAMVTTVFEDDPKKVKNWLAKFQGATPLSSLTGGMGTYSSLAPSPADNQAPSGGGRSPISRNAEASPGGLLSARDGSTNNITPKNGLSSENPGGALYQGAGAPWFQKFLMSELAGPGDAREGRAPARPDERELVPPLFQSIGEQGAARLDALEAKASEGGRRLEALRTAREMEEAGKDAKAIRLATGWEKGKDGKWRWEIPDLAVRPGAKLEEHDDRLAGEVEARNASARMGMTPEERRATLLAETEDVAREDQIVMLDGQSAMMAMEESAAKTARAELAAMPAVPLANRASVRAEAVAAINGFLNQDIVNASTGIVARVSTTGRKKSVSGAAVEKSKANGFTAAQHYAVAANLKTLYEQARLLESGPDAKNNDPRVLSVKRFGARIDVDGEPAVAYMTVKETVEAGHRIYSVELQEMEAGGNLREAPEGVTRFMQPGPADVNIPNLSSGVNGWSLTRDGAHLIHLAKTADKSTFLHEVLHVFMRELEEGQRAGTLTEEGAAIWDAIAAHLEPFRASGEGEDVGSFFSRSQHERLAREWEAYLLEGKEPSPQLRRPFAAIREWLAQNENEDVMMANSAA